MPGRDVSGVFALPQASTQTGGRVGPPGFNPFVWAPGVKGWGQARVSRVELRIPYRPSQQSCGLGVELRHGSRCWLGGGFD